MKFAIKLCCEEEKGIHSVAEKHERKHKKETDKQLVFFFPFNPIRVALQYLGLSNANSWAKIIEDKI